MKHLLKAKYLPYLTLGMSGAALVLRWLLYAVAVDEKNLLPLGHPLELLLWLLTAAAAALIIAVVWKLDGSSRYGNNFRPSVAAMVGSCAMAAGIVITVLTMDPAKTSLETVRNVMGLVSALGLIWAGIDRLRGKRPFFLTYTAAAVFFALYMVGRYQTWSGNPQLQDYVYSLLGCMALTLFAYYLAAFSIGAGKRRMQLAVGLLGMFACGAALPHAEAPMLYLTGGIWAFTNLCRLKPVPKEPAQPEE